MTRAAACWIGVSCLLAVSSCSLVPGSDEDAVVQEEPQAEPEARPAPVRRYLDTGLLLKGNGGQPHVVSPGHPPFDREQYDPVEETGFRSPALHPLSTFSIDVDTASYANVRRLLREGRRPPAGAVRIEELVNYFRYDRDARPGRTPFAVRIEAMPAPWAPQHHLVRIGLRGRDLPDEELPPRNLVFLLDVSGSMQPADKLPLVKRAMAALTEQLREEDRVSIAVYAGSSGRVLPPTSGADRGKILDALSRLQAGGSTNGGQGIRLAYSLARENFDPQGINRVILATDGDFNVGTTSRSELVDLIEQERESGVFLTVLGVGTGNLQDASMEELADNGNGNYAYLDSFAEARKVLVREAGSTLVTIAKDVKIQVEFNPSQVAAYRLVGYENRRLAPEDFNDDRKDAGEIGAGHSVTALYEVVPVGVESPAAGVDPLRYQEPAQPVGSHQGELLTVKLRYKAPDGDESERLEAAVPAVLPDVAAASDDLRFSAAVALFGMLLQSSEYTGSGSFGTAQELARGALGSDPYGDRAEFLQLVALARDLPAHD